MHANREANVEVVSSLSLSKHISKSVVMQIVNAFVFQVQEEEAVAADVPVPYVMTEILEKIKDSS